MTPHLNGLIETVQMRDHNISFYADLTKIIPKVLFNTKIIPKVLFNRQKSQETEVWPEMHVQILVSTRI